MAVFQSLYSGSSGNCAVVREGATALAVDMGKNCKTTLAAFSAAGVDPGSLGGILVTHEHSDHVAGLEVFLKRYPVPVFGSAATLGYLADHRLVSAHTDLIPLEPGAEMIVGEIVFSGFRTSHDSADCFGYRFLFPDGGCAAIATDLGCVTAEVREAVSGCRFVALESNYDEGMLRLGRYPLYLKRRIASRFGHLSNLDCAGTLAELAGDGTEHFMLMHLSEENNAPQVALTTCLGIFENGGISPACQVEIAPRYRVSGAVQI